MTSLTALVQKKKYILLNNLGSKQSLNEFWPVHLLLQNKIFHQKIRKTSANLWFLKTENL